MKNYVLAISGGVDSRVLLDMALGWPESKLIVAHFDHGIRADSVEDEAFVRKLAQKYDLIFESKREELGPNASEELARERRYAFLKSVAQKYNAKLVTAHHGDDVIETIAINLIRGTGWRGLAVLDSPDIYRPMTSMFKSEIIEYANSHNLTWREDSTNQSDDYLRNRVRSQTSSINLTDKKNLLKLWRNQLEIKKEIDSVTCDITCNLDSPFSRDFFNNLPGGVEMEILRKLTNGKLTRPQMRKTIDAIKNFSSAKTLQAGNGIEFKFTTRNFSIRLIK